MVRTGYSFWTTAAKTILYPNKVHEKVAFCGNWNDLFIHENFRWQAPIRAVKQAIDSGLIGKVFKARVSFCSAFPVFDNQPFLAELGTFYPYRYWVTCAGHLPLPLW